MGLDMYVYAKKSSYKSFSHWDKKKGQKDVTDYPEDLGSLNKYIEDRNFKSHEITETFQIGYFRKFNALHAYIVNNFARGEDCCQEIYLNKEDIKKLVDDLEKVNKENAEKVMPTQDGFFFGSTDYDDWYYQDVEEAKTLFKTILHEVDLEKYNIVYQASW